MKKLRIISAFIIAAAAANVAMGEMQADRMWKELNSDHDSVLSLEEAKKSEMVSKQWHLLDVNQDSKLTYKEFLLIDMTKK